MLNQKTTAVICLGIFAFGFIFENLMIEHKPIQHEPIKTQVSYFYNLIPITVSGTASTVVGPINLIKTV